MRIGDFLKILAWEFINPIILKHKKHNKYNFNNHIGLNLGCGLDNPSNWLGIDGSVSYYFVQKAPKIIAKQLFGFFNLSQNYTYDTYNKKAKSLNLIHHDLSFGIPFDDETIPNIYTSHFLEHLFYSEAENLLDECYRVLKKGGKIRVVVPSLEKEVIRIKYAIDEYNNGNYEPIQLFVTTNIVGYQAKYSTHKYMYNFNILKKTLESVGFRNLKEYSFRVGEIPDVEFLDSREESIFVEAIK